MSASKAWCRPPSGYSGGSADTATYRQVITETTGHAESVEVVYDPARITYGQLLRIFFSVAHDPTQLNRQGPDVGTSYRSAIFYANDEQKRIATAYIAQLNAAKVFPGPIVTEVTPLKAFYRAEDYHQDFALKNPDNAYIQICDLPKISALKAAISRAVCGLQRQPLTGLPASNDFQPSFSASPKFPSHPRKGVRIWRLQHRFRPWIPTFLNS